MSKSEVRVLYDHDVHPSPALREYLVKALHNHMVFYNHMLQMYSSNRLMTRKQINDLARAELANGQFSPYIAPALFNDIYYLWKKNNFRQKLFTSIQYMTLVLSRWDCVTLQYCPDKCELRFTGAPEALTLPAPLPTIPEGLQCYFTLSYAPSSDNFRIAVCPLGNSAVSDESRSEIVMC